MEAEVDADDVAAVLLAVVALLVVAAPLLVAALVVVAASELVVAAAELVVGAAVLAAVLVVGADEDVAALEPVVVVVAAVPQAASREAPIKLVAPPSATWITCRRRNVAPVVGCKSVIVTLISIFATLHRGQRRPCPPRYGCHELAPGPSIASATDTLPSSVYERRATVGNRVIKLERTSPVSDSI